MIEVPPFAESSLMDGELDLLACGTGECRVGFGAEVTLTVSMEVTPAQAVSRNRLSKISRTFRQLSDSQINQWKVLAGHMKGISTLGSAAEMTAHNAFVRINTNLQMVGEPLMTDAPAYLNDIPEVLYDDLWISPDMIVFTGLQQPSESHVLVFKMTPALSPGVSSGWPQSNGVTRAYSKAVQIVTPLEAVCEEYDIKQDYDNKHGAPNAAAPKVFIKYFFVNTKTGEKSGEMLTMVRLDEDASAEGE